MNYEWTINIVIAIITLAPIVYYAWDLRRFHKRIKADREAHEAAMKKIWEEHQGLTNQTFETKENPNV